MSLEKAALLKLQKEIPSLMMGRVWEKIGAWMMEREWLKSTFSSIEEMLRSLEDDECGDDQPRAKSLSRLKKDYIKMAIDEIKNCRRLPDAFYFNDIPSGKFGNIGFPEVVFIEVEDTSKLTSEKLRDYTELWFSFDSSSIMFRVIIANRYGTIVDELDLGDLFYNWKHDELSPADC